jgi:hypothetical protein
MNCQDRNITRSLLKRMTNLNGKTIFQKDTKKKKDQAIFKPKAAVDKW